MSEARLYLGIDVGTGSVRAGLFDESGRKHGQGVHPIQIFRPAEDFAEQSSEDIWNAAGVAVRFALAEAGAPPDAVRGVGFDATCSLVAVDAAGRPVSVSPTARDEQNVVLWMDHRAIDEAARINATGHDVLRYVGGVISPEMEMPKLAWLSRHHPECWRRAHRFFDLPDYLTFRATGSETRSLCTTVCKWTYLGHEGRWADDFLEQIGLGELARDGHARIGERVRPLGETLGHTTEAAARELGIAAGTPVGVSIIDAHAGGLGLLGTGLGAAVDEAMLETRLALIGGTSSCHMAVSQKPRYVAGVWGPYFSAMVPGMWLTEGGQSATGALIDHVIQSHVRGPELASAAAREGTTVYALLNRELERLAEGKSVHSLTAELHVFPDFHGNRSPRADPTLRGMLSGLKLTDSLSSLALLYLATIQAIAHGTRHILSALTASGYRIDTILACGGDTKNPLFVREHADITGCRIVLPQEPEAVLLGSALLGAVAAGRYPSVVSAMAHMSQAGSVIEPRGVEVSAYHARKHAVFQRMYDDQMAYRELMGG